MSERRGRAGDAGIADQNVEFAVALMQRRAEPGDTVEVGEIERHQSGGSAVLSDLVVELFEPGLGPRHRHHMRAGFCQRPRGGIADAARGAGDQSDTGGKREGHLKNNSINSRPRERGDPYAVTAMRRKVFVSNGVRKTKAGGYGSPRSRGRRERINSPPPAAIIAAAAARPGSGR